MKTLKKDKFSLALLIYNILILSLSIGYFSYALLLLQKIETLLRIGIIIFFVIISIIIVILILKNTFKRKKIKILITTIVTTIFAGIITFIGFNVNKIYTSIANITSSSQTYSASIVTNINNEIETINDIKNSKIGILNDQNSIDGYQIPQEIIKENKLDNELVEYNNYLDLINDLLDEKIEAIFLPTNYSILFASIQGLENLNEKTKIIYTKDKNIKVQTTLNTKNLDEPFTVLLMGVDSENEDIAGSSFNGDSLILITFNPKTLNATMLSIPRDTYTPITCFAGQRKNKITHAAWYGESCMMSTISNMFDINIDYYIKINFKGVVNIVDALGGVDVNVPYSFCEQNSNREFGDKMLYIDEGFRTLNGEEALALARNRKIHEECGPKYTDYNSNDFIRGQNQQLIIQGMLNKLKTINSIDTFYDMLNSISRSMETNMSTENILSFYNIGKDILTKNTSNSTNLAELIGFERMYLSGYDEIIVDYDSIYDTGSGLALYNFVPYQGSIKDISEAMKINLGLMDKKIIKEYTFNVNEPYEQTVIGKGYYNEGGVSLLPSFVGRDLSEAQNYCSRLGIPVTVNKITTNSKSMDNQIMTQSLPSGMDTQYISRSQGITLSVAEYKTTKTEEPTPSTTPKPTTEKKPTDTKTEETTKEEPKPNTTTETTQEPTNTDIDPNIKDIIGLKPEEDKETEEKDA